MATTCSSYYPSQSEIEQFWNEEASREKANVEIPHGYPQELHSPLAWTRADAEKKRSEWIIELEVKDIDAINAALSTFETKNDDLSSISASTFELPTSLSERLRRVSDQIYHGLGFKIIHGLDPSKYTPRQNIIVYAGVSSHIFPQRGFVDQAGEEVIVHIVNVQGEKADPETKAPGFSNIPLSFHTDNCEIMSFYYLDTAVGGQTILTSSWQTYNELATKRPEILHTLAEPWVLDTFKPYALFPPRHVRLLEKSERDQVLLRFSRYPLTGWQRKRNPNLPAPTPAQLEAIDAVQFTAMTNAITLPVIKGDLLFVNDMALMHAREGFDEEGVYLKRHLVKMFFRDPEKDWSIPKSVMDERAKIYGPNRADGTRKERWHIFHEPGLEENAPMNG